MKKIFLSAVFILLLLGCGDSSVDVVMNYERIGDSSSSIGEYWNPNIDYGTIHDNRDGKTYRTVKIGTQTWMAENLNYPTASGSWCYNNDVVYCVTYGRLYDWATATDGSASSDIEPSGIKGICPLSWHLPSEAEWQILSNYVSNYNAGTKLKALYGWKSNPYGDGTDSYGFSALPGGNYTNGSFDLVGSNGYWWTATGNGKVMGYGSSDVFSLPPLKLYGFSVRCVLDISPDSSSSSSSAISSSSSEQSSSSSIAKSSSSVYSSSSIPSSSSSSSITKSSSSGAISSSSTISSSSSAQSSSSSDSIALTNEVWVIGNFNAFVRNQKYSFSVVTGKTYIIKWDDLYEGSGDYSVDVIVSAAYSYSGLSIGGSLFSNEDSGYNPPQSFTATNTGTVIVTVVPYSPGDVGDYRIKYSIGELE